MLGTRPASTRISAHNKSPCIEKRGMPSACIACSDCCARSNPHPGELRPAEHPGHNFATLQGVAIVVAGSRRQVVGFAPKGIKHAGARPGPGPLHPGFFRKENRPGLNPCQVLCPAKPGLFASGGSFRMPVKIGHDAQRSGQVQQAAACLISPVFSSKRTRPIWPGQLGNSRIRNLPLPIQY